MITVTGGAMFTGICEHGNEQTGFVKAVHLLTR
jgi:hypothetical protein